uniref:Uncharacterized protein n=1 Tax=Chromera velia CCMP2878 TaxID=1169474 RepID=A0A0G4IE28_9ALVE|eukprot:Cvel_2382.t1-p1 / transcript=Cvel_2382.t1 / gene=Cvel_2382 / organism=Chromera_velia_CCMP2878 / gene_product=hypothetical protein / transcript_product=hypothetical protein / location=Cvel_scaffold92:109391-112223(+) / protein_length=71 / sequence_SO=supercontig / SO=protein_coding / is_pseudo=false
MSTIRRGVTFFLIVVLIWITAASQVEYAYHWGAVLAFLGSLFIADLMFLNDEDFMFDPFYQNWAKKTDPQY